MRINVLYNYRDEGIDIVTNKGTFKVMIIRAGIKGIVANIHKYGLVVLWGKDVANDHVNDSEEALIQKTIDVING